MTNKLLFVFILLSNLAVSQNNIYRNDFDQFWNDVNNYYAYLHQQNIDWQKVQQIYSPVADTINNNADFIRFLETVINELHNGHSSLNTNLRTSNRLVPSGSDVFVEKINQQYIITDVRQGSGAEKCGLKIGMEVVQFNDNDIESQLLLFLPRYTNQHNASMVQYAISMLFAGTHDKKRKISITNNNIITHYYPDDIEIQKNNTLLDCKILDKHTGYIKINNSLGNNNLISEFDNALDSLLTKKQLIIDLTETPNGGNTTVARAIMGRFITEKLPFQQHQYEEKKFGTIRNWVEYVTPRKNVYNGKIIVMVGHWTGSMGEGMAIGFDGMKRATVVGTQMAGLLGAIEGFTLLQTQIGFQIPTEELYHVNGTPREQYKPKILTKNTVDTWQTVRKIFKIKQP